MAKLLGWLLLLALPASAQVDRVTGIETPSSPVVVVPGAASVGGAAGRLDPGLALSGSRFKTSFHHDAAISQALEQIRSAPMSHVDPKIISTFQEHLVKEELAHIEPRLRGRELTAERRDKVLEATKFRDVRWYHRFDDTVSPDGRGIPEGRAYEDGRIALFVKRGWQKMPNVIEHFKVLFSHEYTHRLQTEGEVGWKGAFVEIPAYSTEILRALELFGVDGVRGGALDMVGPGVMAQFDHGRKWIETLPKSGDGFYYRGFLAGAAYQIGVQTGNWDDAWAFHRRVSAGEDPAVVARGLLGAAK